MELIRAKGESVELTWPRTTNREEPALVSSGCCLGNLTSCLRAQNRPDDTKRDGKCSAYKCLLGSRPKAGLISPCHSVLAGSWRVLDGLVRAFTASWRQLSFLPPNTLYQPVPSLILPCDSDPMCDRHRPLPLTTSHKAVPDGTSSPSRGRATLLTRCTHPAPDVGETEAMAIVSIKSPMIVKGKVNSQVQGQPGKSKQQFRNQPENRCNYSKAQEGDKG